MISTRWIEARKPQWARLEELLQRCSRQGLGRLSHRELGELGVLYRQTAADLSTSRQDATSRRLAEYLNGLLGRAHGLVYRTRRAEKRSIVEFYRDAYPKLLRETAGYTAAAFGIFLAGALAGWSIAAVDPGFQRFLLGGEMVDTIERRKMWTHSILTVMPLASSAILTNNLSVAFVTAASGIAAGIGTLFFLLFNGVLLGTIGAACWRSGMSLQLWSFVAPHGAFELPAIFIAGGAGLILARGLLFPGPYTRRDSIALEGGRAVRLVLGVIPLLLVAGVIEGFVSPTGLPAAAKLTLGAMLGTVLLLYARHGTGRYASKCHSAE